MAVSWSTILRLVPNIAAGLLPGLVNRGVAGLAQKSIAGTILSGGAYAYPEMTADFVYPELGDIAPTSYEGRETVLPAMNGDNMSREDINAVLAQSLEQHNRAVMRGDEDRLMEWWPGKDTKPRRTLSPKSTAVQNIRINRDNTISIQFRNGSKWYTYRGGENPREASEAVKDLLTYPSIGRAINRHIKNEWMDSKHLMNNRRPIGPAKPGVDGQWGKDHYDAGWFAG